MYLVTKKKMKGKIVSLDEQIGYPMGSKNKEFKIGGVKVKNILIINPIFSNCIVSNQVMKNYSKLIEFLTALFIDDDDTGETMREALRQIERFRLQIKNKYRKFLKKKELELMSKQLSKLQKAANMRLIEIHNSYIDQLNNNRSK